MGLIKNGKWIDRWYDTESTGGEFQRQESRFREWVTADGSSPYMPGSNRYHLFVSLACPWAHRTLIFRKLKQLEAHISISVVQPVMLENGWEFPDGGDPLTGSRYFYEVYLQSTPDYQGRVTVPVLWDKQCGQIVNNESADIIRILNSEFNGITGNDLDFYPRERRETIDAINKRVYADINNGVYQAGFATTQTAYTEAYSRLFRALDWVESILARQPYLAGDEATEADWRLFTSLIRFDAVYHGHFKCNRQRLEDFPNLSNYLRALYQWPGVAETVNFNHIKQHYYRSHTGINPTGIVPAGPQIDFFRPHNRPDRQPV